MALNSYLQLKGQKQGDIKGSITQKGREGRIMVIAFNHEVRSPVDASGGLPVGRKVHKPFTITKEIDKSSPLLYSALVNNENLTFWELQCFAAGRAGVEINTYKVNLTNARIVDIKSIMLNNKITENAPMPMMEEVSFVYQKIQWTWVAGGITSQDDWSEPV